MTIRPEEFQRLAALYQDHRAQCEALLTQYWPVEADEKYGVSTRILRKPGAELAFRFETRVKAAPERVLCDLYDIRTVIPELSDSKRGGTIFRFIYFPDDKTRKGVCAMMDGGHFSAENDNIVYQAVYSPSSLVKSRDVLCYRRALELEPEKHYYIHINSVMAYEKRVEELEREAFVAVFDISGDADETNITACCTLDPPSTAPAMLVEAKLRSFSTVIAELREKYK